jgi:hypothetical protein
MDATNKAREFGASATNVARQFGSDAANRANEVTASNINAARQFSTGAENAESQWTAAALNEAAKYGADTRNEQTKITQELASLEKRAADAITSGQADRSLSVMQSFGTTLSSQLERIYSNKELDDKLKNSMAEGITKTFNATMNILSGSDAFKFTKEYDFKSLLPPVEAA